jgi:hypothetical protein
MTARRSLFARLAGGLRRRTWPEAYDIPVCNLDRIAFELVTRPIAARSVTDRRPA